MPRKGKSKFHQISKGKTLTIFGEKGRKGNQFQHDRKKRGISSSPEAGGGKTALHVWESKTPWKNTGKKKKKAVKLLTPQEEGRAFHARRQIRRGTLRKENNSLKKKKTHPLLVLNIYMEGGGNIKIPFFFFPRFVFAVRGL